MVDLATRRRFFAEELQACYNLRTPGLVEALAAVPREQFLGPGPWMFQGEGDMATGPRQTPDADPKHVCHNVSVAIDLSRRLFNGAPGVVSMAIDALALRPGDRVMHLGCGLGYYTALLARIVGPHGHVCALEVDETLAGEAKANLSAEPNVDVRRGNGTEPIEGRLDAMLVNAGLTLPPDAWLDAIVVGGRLVMPVTSTPPQMGTIGKGLMVAATKTSDVSFDARMLSMVAIYSAIGLRDEALNEAIGKALMRGPFVPLKRLRRDPHEPSPACWLHGPTMCLSC
jgi:protein-L-isoaspartate(D-aspartate) O-methyltransferase